MHACHGHRYRPSPVPLRQEKEEENGWGGGGGPALVGTREYKPSDRSVAGGGCLGCYVIWNVP